MTGPSAESATGIVDSPVDPDGPADPAHPPVVAGILVDAADQARAAATEFSGAETVGDYLGVDYEDRFAATHRFAAQLPGYHGWQWAVVVAAHPGSAHATVSEVVLIPGPTALLAPEWVPWDQRVKPGDLGPGDLLPPSAGDARLVPGYTASGDRQVDDVAAEIGLGRRWVLSAEGRFDAAQRWHDGDYGPDSAMARSTKRVCRDCGFYLPLAGALGRMFGVCGNAMSADGRVVDAGYGCGAHTDTPPAPAGAGSPAYDPYDDGALDVIEVAGSAPAETVTEATVPADAEPEPAEAAEPAAAPELAEAAEREAAPEPAGAVEPEAAPELADVQPADGPPPEPGDPAAS